jgi:hypothetical protein
MGKFWTVETFEEWAIRQRAWLAADLPLYVGSDDSMIWPGDLTLLVGIPTKEQSWQTIPAELLAFLGDDVL